MKSSSAYEKLLLEAIDSPFKNNRLTGDDRLYCAAHCFTESVIQSRDFRKISEISSLDFSEKFEQIASVVAVREKMEEEAFDRFFREDALFAKWKSNKTMIVIPDKLCDELVETELPQKIGYTTDKLLELAKEPIVIAGTFRGLPMLFTLDLGDEFVAGPLRMFADDPKTCETSPIGPLGNVYFYSEGTIMASNIGVLFSQRDRKVFLCAKPLQYVLSEKEEKTIMPLIGDAINTALPYCLLSDNLSFKKVTTPKGNRPKLQNGAPLNITQLVVTGEDVEQSERNARLLSENALEISSKNILPAKFVINDTCVKWVCKKVYTDADLEKLHNEGAYEELQALHDQFGLKAQFPMLTYFPELCDRLLTKNIDPLLICQEDYKGYKEYVTGAPIQSKEAVTAKKLYKRLNSWLGNSLASCRGKVYDFSTENVESHYRNKNRFIDRAIFSLLGEKRREALYRDESIAPSRQDELYAAELYLLISGHGDCLSFKNKKIDYKLTAKEKTIINALSMLICALRNVNGQFVDVLPTDRAKDRELASLKEEVAALRAENGRLSQALREAQDAEAAATEVLDRKKEQNQRELRRMEKERRASEHGLLDQIKAQSREIENLKQVLAATSLMLEDEDQVQKSVVTEETSEAETLVEMPEDGVVFMGGHPNLVKKIRQRHPRWSFVGREAFADTGVFACAKVVVIYWKSICHPAYYKALERTERGDSVPIVYVNSTNLDLLEEEIRRGYNSAIA